MHYHFKGQQLVNSQKEKKMNTSGIGLVLFLLFVLTELQTNSSKLFFC